MLEAGHKAVRLVISGTVQGVWYRAWVEERANAMELDGWIRNRADDTVETLIVGPDAQVDQMVEYCWEGPRLANVTDIKIRSALGITAKGFVLKPTVDIERRRG